MAKTDKKDFVYAVGKRKESSARVRVYDVKELPFGEEVLKRGDIVINGKKIGEYFSDKVSQAMYSGPLKLTNTIDKYIITIKTQGGGMSGQLDAVIHGISRALSSMSPENRSVLKKAGLLTRDARVRERRKVGMGGKARRKKQSPKR
jgi:small subunit ribosomal protein S9